MFGMLQSNKQPNRKTYDEKLAEEQYDLFTARDVVEHFERYYKKWSGKPKEFSRDHGIKTTEELFQMGYTPADLTLYIEFVFDSDQTEIDREKCMMGTFKVNKWVDYIEQNLPAFENGESVKKVADKVDFEKNIDRNKEWDRERKGRVSFALPKYY